ncbi:MAG: MarR family transcriptional regulator [Paludibacteraceae bacterium]
MEELKKTQDVGVNEISILELIKNNPKITANEITLHLNLSLRQVERLLASMKKNSLIAREGSDKRGEWKIIN